jgi:hypothetical protein
VQKNRRTSRPRRNPELLKKGTRLTGSFSDDGSGWRYSDEYPSIRGQRWVASLGLSRDELSVEGATEYDPSFRSSLFEMVAQYPELSGLEARFDGPRIPIATLLVSEVPAIKDTSWLHGTSSVALRSIAASGLRPRGETGAAAAFVGAAGPSRPEHVYLTTQRNMAHMAARAAARSDGGVPVVLRVAPLSVSRMDPDEDSGTDTAEESFWRIGSVAYRGSIPSSKVAVDEVLRDGEWSAGDHGIIKNYSRPVLYHGSNDPDLEELDGNDPGYTGSLGWGLYLTTDPDFAKIFGKHVYEVESPVPDELVADIEPDSYDCGNDLTFYTPGSAPFTFEIVDRKTRKKHRYSVLGDCDEQVREGLRKWALEGFAPSQELNDAGRALPQAAAKHVAQAARAVLEAASESQRVDDVIDTMVDVMAENGVDDATLDDQVRPLLEALAEEIEKVADEKIAERLGDEIDLSDLSATVSEHGYGAFFISGYAPGDEYVIVDTEYLPIPVTKS